MNAEQKASKVLELLGRAGAWLADIPALEDPEKASLALKVCALVIDDRQAPDKTWWREYFTLSGDHWVLTDEGWVPGEMNTREVCGDEPAEVLDEVNAPAMYTASAFPPSVVAACIKHPRLVDDLAKSLQEEPQEWE